MYQLMILDYSMPEMDGPQVAIEIRNMLQSQDIKIPYICCYSAYTEASYERNALSVGMN